MMNRAKISLTALVSLVIILATALTSEAATWGCSYTINQCPDKSTGSGTGCYSAEKTDVPASDTDCAIDYTCTECTGATPNCAAGSCCLTVNGVLAASWSACSDTCAGGTGTQTKACSPVASCGGTGCTADATQDCNRAPCCGNAIVDGTEDCDGAVPNAAGDRSRVCGTGGCAGTQTRGCSATCAWDPWGTCTTNGLANCVGKKCCKCESNDAPAEVYDGTQNSDCSANDVTCTDGCGKGGCSATLWGSYAVSSVASACNGAVDACTSPSCPSATCDADTTDGDGYGGGGPGSACYDCKPSDAAFNPGKSENNCNDRDDDCDGTIDEDYAGLACGIGGCLGGTTQCSTKNDVCGAPAYGCGPISCGQITCSKGNADCGTCCKCTGPSCDPLGATPNPVSNYDETQDLLPYTASVYDSYDCPETSCPADACGPVGGCATTQLADYPATVANTCEGEGVCTTNACTPTCQSGSDADKIHASCGDCNDVDPNVYPASCHIDAIAWGDPAVTPLAGEPCPAVVAATPAVPDPPNNNLQNCICDESTPGGCNSGTCTRDTDGVVCDNEIRVCTAGQNPFCNVGAGGDIWADTNTDKNCDTLCSGTPGLTDADCNPACIPPSCDTAFYEECERCDGQTSPSPFAVDTINDYEPCSAGKTACPYTPYTDFCSTPDVLTEYYCSGVDHTSTIINCNSYDGECVGTCGTGADSCTAKDYSCSTGACTYSLIDIDTAEGWCTAPNPGCAVQGVEWLAGGEAAAFAEYDTGTSYECCGDDNSEKVRFRDCAPGACTDDTLDRVCCNVETDCVFKDVCYNDVDSVISAVQGEREAFCSIKTTPAACTSGNAKHICTWSGGVCSSVATKAAVQASQLEHMATGGLGPSPAYDDIDNDGFYEVCDAASPGLWREALGTVTGYVRNVSTSNCLGVCTPVDCSLGCPVSGALVKILPKGPTVTTNANGAYTISGVSSGTHDFVAAKIQYDASTVLGRFIADGATENVDFVLGQTLGGCEDDCTAIGSNVCDPICHGRGLCWYYSDDTKAICGGTFGIVEVVAGPYAGQYIDCCKGRPYTPVKTGDVKVDAKNVVTIKKPVLYKGRFVNMVIVVFRS